MIGIYKITSPTNKIYIGSSKDIEDRFKQYKRLQCIGQRKLYNSLKKHGIENHIFEIILECDLLNLLKIEGYYIDLYDSISSGLNCQKPNEDGRIEFSEETKLIISKNMKDHWKNMTDEEKSNRLYNFIQSTKGRKPTKETIEKIKESSRFPLYGDKNYMFNRSDLIHNSLNVVDNYTGKKYDSLSQCAKDLSTYPKKIKRLIDKGDKRFELIKKQHI